MDFMKKIVKKKQGKTFSERVVEAVMTIPKGRVTTYGRIARACGGGAMASQSITGILAKAFREQELLIPFHRIVYANGTIWINDEYKAKRMKLYKEEGIEVDQKGKIKDFEKIVFEFR
jgi:methylated-DNA-protein-cysteine methyltransferase-like protein